MSKLRFVVVGGGLAAARAVESARTAGFDGEILLVGEEPRLPYERPPLSKEWLTDPEPPAEPLVFTPDRWDAWQVERQLGNPARVLDPTTRTLHLSDGTRLRYDRLLIATGARARRLDVPGDDLDGVLALRSLPDAAVLRDRLRAAHRVVVIGAGLIGLEVAAAARTLGRSVTVLEAGAAPLGRLLAPELGGRVADLHVAHGVEMRFRSTVSRFRGRTRVEAVVLESGESLDAELVVMGIGVVPETGWLRGTGLGGPHGVLVDTALRTAMPNVYAAGDVAAIYRPRGSPIRVETYASAAAQGAAVGRTLAGRVETVTPTLGGSSTQFGRRLQFVGDLRDAQQVVTRGDHDRFVAFSVRDERVVGAFSFDRPRDLPLARRLVATGARVPPEALADVDADLTPWAVG